MLVNAHHIAGRHTFFKPSEHFFNKTCNPCNPTCLQNARVDWSDWSPESSSQHLWFPVSFDTELLQRDGLIDRYIVPYIFQILYILYLSKYVYKYLTSSNARHMSLFLVDIYCNMYLYTEIRAAVPKDMWYYDLRSKPSISSQLWSGLGFW